MWNRDHSLQLSILSVKLFFVIWVILLLGGYYICHMYVEFMNSPSTFSVLLLTLYLCLIPAFIILYDLYKVLINIKNNQVFMVQNAMYLRWISWSCLLVSLISVISAFGYLPFLFIAVAFGFLALLIRVIKNIITQAIEIKAENDYTI